MNSQQELHENGALVNWIALGSAPIVHFQQGACVIPPIELA